MKCCLIGKTLKHSYSKIIHEKFGEYPYDLVELKDDEVKDFVLKKEYDAYNVTIPYKEVVMPYLDKIDDFALEIGSVNTVVKKDGKLYGYNTDFSGMKYMIESAGLSVKDKNVLILGTGGTSKTARAVCKYLKAKNVWVVSRKGELNYSNCQDLDAEIIINTTPVGMYPNCFDSPLDITVYKNLEGVVDVIYNPNLTKICFDAKNLNLKHVNGLSMLVAQAKYAKDYFLGKIGDDLIIEKVTFELAKETENIFLIGMAGSGKTTVGRAMAKTLNLPFYDTDIEIEKKAKKTIPEIFKENGEDYFRNLETEVLKELSLKRGAIIATGGGIVKREENLFVIKSNGKAIWIKRDPNALAVQGRPLSKDVETAKRLYEERKPLYNKFADVIVENDKTIEDTVKEIILL